MPSPTGRRVSASWENYYVCGLSYPLDAVFYLRISSTNTPLVGHLGFWMAQQGSIICFVALLVTYARSMNKLDEKHGFTEEKPMDQTIWNFIFIGITFGVYIGIANLVTGRINQGILYRKRWAFPLPMVWRPRRTGCLPLPLSMAGE